MKKSDDEKWDDAVVAMTRKCIPFDAFPDEHRLLVYSKEGVIDYHASTDTFLLRHGKKTGNFDGLLALCAEGVTSKKKTGGKVAKRKAAPGILRKHGVSFSIHNHGVHLIVQGHTDVFDYWPGPDKFMSRRGSKAPKFGIQKLIKLCNVPAITKPKPKPVQSMRTFDANMWNHWRSI